MITLRVLKYKLPASIDTHCVNLCHRRLTRFGFRAAVAAAAANAAVAIINYRKQNSFALRPIFELMKLKAF